MLKNLSFSAITVFTLALGIGATGAVFSLIQGVLLTPPPYKRPERLALIRPVLAAQPTPMSRGWPANQWLEWQKEAKSFEAIAAYSWAFNFFVLPGGSESLEGMSVTKEYFSVMGLQPLIGRTFLDSDIGTSSARVVILGYDLWRRRFNGDPNILGKPIRISREDTPPTVIGVMPPGIRFLPSPGAGQEPNYDVNAAVDFWLPTVPDAAELKSPQWDIVGRLRGDATVRQAQAEIAILLERESTPDERARKIVPRVELLSDTMNRDGIRILLPLLGAAALVLLIACGNAAALLLVRGIQSQMDYAVRTALGVPRFALFRQVAAESLLLAMLGGTFGVILSWGVVKIFKVVGGHAIPRLDAVTTGWPVLAWGIGTALVATILAGIYPAWRVSRLDAIDALRSAGSKASAGRVERRFLRAVTVFQTALTMALLVGSGLLIRTMVNLSKVRPGYQTENILTVTVTAVEGDVSDFHHRALERVSAIPGVRNAAFAWGVPLTGNSWPGFVDIEGQPAASNPGDRVQLPVRSVTPGYFNLLGLPVLKGRDFRPDDDLKSRKVAVVNQALADRYFPGSNALGKKIWKGGLTRPPVEIIGIVANGRTSDLRRTPEPELYLPFWQQQAFSKELVIRASIDPRMLIAPVQRVLRSIDSTAAIENPRTLDEIRRNSVAPQAFAAQLLVGFSVIGTILSLVGIFGVLSLSVAFRRRELAIRSAVGARERDIQRLVVTEGLQMISVGVLFGIFAATALSRALTSFLYEVQPFDPAVLFGVALLFTTIAVMACWIPARRAARVHPIEALKCN